MGGKVSEGSIEDRTARGKTWGFGRFEVRELREVWYYVLYP